MMQLDDTQLAAIVAACRPLRPNARCCFLEQLATRLVGPGTIDDSTLHAAIHEVQRQYSNDNAA
jgi:hypothetical protein